MPSGCSGAFLLLMVLLYNGSSYSSVDILTELSILRWWNCSSIPGRGKKFSLFLNVQSSSLGFTQRDRKGRNLRSTSAKVRSVDLYFRSPYFHSPIFSLPIFPLPIFSLLIFPLPIFPLPIFSLPIFPLPIFSLPIFSPPIFPLPIQLKFNFCCFIKTATAYQNNRTTWQIWSPLQVYFVLTDLALHLKLAQVA